MNYRLSVGLLALSASVVVGSNALAAPGVSYKKRLDVPMVPASIISTLENKTPWMFKTITTKVALQAPLLIGEQDCSDVTYRLWRINVDNEKTTKLHPGLMNYEGDYAMPGTRFIYEARTSKAVKWQIDPNEGGVYRAGTDYVPVSFFGCSDKGTVILYTANHPRNYTSNYGLRSVSYKDLDKAATWSTTNLVKRQYGDRASVSQVTRDGITQLPGVLIANSERVIGDSRPLTYEKGRGFILHELPHYRDLTTITGPTTTVFAVYYRLHDGYGVIERTTDSNTVNITKYYRIRNGEARYSEVDSLPLASRLSEDTNGIILNTGSNKSVLVHKIDTAAYTSFNGQSRETPVIWETEAQIYARYLITNKTNGARQYWEAVVNKN